MKYLKVKRDAYDYFSKYGVVKDELITEKERNRLCPYIKEDIFEPVNINKNRTFFNFGVRLEMKGD